MEIKVNFLENLRLEAKFDDFTVVTDQPIRYKGDGSAPSPFDYFLASSVLCAAYFVRVYCLARGISTEGIRLSQNNVVDPKNRYKQVFKIQVELPESISDKDRQGILRSIDRCTVKKVVQSDLEFHIECVDSLENDAQALLLNHALNTEQQSPTFIAGKDWPLEKTIARLTQVLADLGMKIEVASWRNLVPHVWSLHIRDAASPQCFTNGKGATQESALCSALGEFIERLNCNFFYNDQYFGEEIAQSDFVHYPHEKWFQLTKDDTIPNGLLDDYCLAIYDPEEELRGSHLLDTNSGRKDRGICALPFTRLSDQHTVYFPSNLIENLYLSNGMSAGNTIAEAQVQCLSEIFERAVKRYIIENELVLPDVPDAVLQRYPHLLEGINALEAQGFPLLVKDASLGGQYPVACVTLMNPRNGGVFASFGAHPDFEVALERSLTELLQGRSFEGLNDLLPPTFSSLAVSEPNNFVEHFIDSTGVISWRFFSAKADYEFCEWDFVPADVQPSRDDVTQPLNEALVQRLFALLQQQNKEVYMATYTDLGVPACRILVPGYSEVYPVDDLIWDNTNVALEYREDILNLHILNDEQLTSLLNRLDASQLDPYMDIKTLIGIEFDENTPWGQLTILELQLLICLALQRHEEALEFTETLLQYNTLLPDRVLFYRAVQTLLEITLDPSLSMADFKVNLGRMYGVEMTQMVLDSIKAEIKFYGLTPTSLKLEGLDRHLRLIASYKKLHQARALKKNR